MNARGSGIAALLGALVLAGCGGDEPAPFKEVKPQGTTTDAAVTIDTPGADALSGLAPRQRSSLAALVAAREALLQRGDAVAQAATDASEIAARVGAGYAAPSGGAPEIRRLADALSAFGGTLDAIASQASLLPQLSAELQLRYVQLRKKRPIVAAHLLDAKQEVETNAAALPELSRGVEDAARKAKAQFAEDTLDAGELEEAITGGSHDATAALNGVNQAVGAGLAALSAAA